jgi:hypothetical protein
MSQMDSMIPIDSINQTNPIDSLIKESIHKSIKKSNLNSLQNLAINLEISIKNELNKNKVKTTLIQEIQSKFNQLTNQDIINNIKIKKINLGIDIRVKDLLNNNISIDAIINTGICLDLQVFFDQNSDYKNLFNNICDLTMKNHTVTSINCLPIECQGLYILTIGKNGIDYIVKLGSFAESQGMSKRIASFGGGCYETGSLTNKWFQEFISKAFKEGYNSKLTYFNKKQEKISITDLNNKEILIIPYVIRPLETQLFKKYHECNNNIAPIFGSNCLKPRN